MSSKKNKIVKKLLEGKLYSFDEIKVFFNISNKELCTLLIEIFREKIIFNKTQEFVASDFKVGMRILNYSDEIFNNEQNFIHDLYFILDKINKDFLSRFTSNQQDRLKQRINSKLRLFYSNDSTLENADSGLFKNIVDFLSNKTIHEYYSQFIRIIPTLIESKHYEKNLSLIEKLLGYYKNLLIHEEDIFTIYYCEQIILKIVSELNSEYYRNQIVNIILKDKALLKSLNLDEKKETRYLLFLDEIFNCFNIDRSFLKMKLTNKLECKYQLNLSLPPVNDTEMMNRFTVIRSRNTNRIQKKIITIDDIPTTFFDDAISLDVLDNGNLLLTLYVSDVSSMVEKGSRLDVSALEKGINIYAGNKMHPIFPFEFMAEYLSLKKNQVRPVVVYKFEFSPSYDLVNSNVKIEQGIIQVTENFNYNDIYDILNQPKKKKDYMVLKKLLELSEKLGKSYNQKGIHLNNQKHVHGEKIIRTLMIFLNQYLAEKFKEMDIPFIYRGSKKISDYSQLVGVSKERLYRHVNTDDTFAYYSNKPVHHSKIGIDTYAHTTSPIRNYASLENQRIIKKILVDGKRLSNKEIYELEKRLYSLAIYLNNRSNLNNDYIHEKELLFKARKK